MLQPLNPASHKYYSFVAIVTRSSYEFFSKQLWVDLGAGVNLAGGAKIGLVELPLASDLVTFALA